MWFDYLTVLYNGLENSQGRLCNYIYVYSLSHQTCHIKMTSHQFCVRTGAHKGNFEKICLFLKSKSAITSSFLMSPPFRKFEKYWKFRLNFKDAVMYEWGRKNRGKQNRPLPELSPLIDLTQILRLFSEKLCNTAGYFTNQFLFFRAFRPTSQNN